MRSAAALLLLLPLLAGAQEAGDAFEITQRFANAGARQITLTRIERLQPAAQSAARWGDSEQLRCMLITA